MLEGKSSYDYTKKNLAFKIKKTLRSIRLYGLSQTLAKIKSQYHMKAISDFHGDKWINPKCTSPNDNSRVVAIIGSGKYAFSSIAYHLNHETRKFLRCTYSHGKQRAMSLCKSYVGAYATSDWRDILSDTQVKIVFIASNNASHVEYAVACIAAGKHVHIEKPHALTQDQLTHLLDAMKKNPKSKVFLGFNRPRSHLFGQLQEFLARDRGLGSILINWFIAIRQIPKGEQAFDHEEGGAFLGHICHWTDLTLHLIKMENAFPCVIASVTSPDKESTLMISIEFPNQSLAAITFSAKGCIDGLYEILNIHKGNLIANLTNFSYLNVETVDTKKSIRLFHLDTGEQANIVHSFMGGTNDQIDGEAYEYVSATAQLFLAVSEAVYSGKAVTLTREKALGHAS
jgi:predicted dehydrogenase